MPVGFAYIERNRQALAAVVVEPGRHPRRHFDGDRADHHAVSTRSEQALDVGALAHATAGLHAQPRSEEHTSELQSLMRISYAVFCLKKKKKKKSKTKHN